MVELQLAKLVTRVRFPVSAQNETFCALGALKSFLLHISRRFKLVLVACIGRGETFELGKAKSSEK